MNILRLSVTTLVVLALLVLLPHTSDAKSYEEISCKLYMTSTLSVRVRRLHAII